MNSWKVILATMVIFGTGVVTGGLLVTLSTRPPALQHPPGQNVAKQTFQPGSAGGMRVELLRRMSRELDLTPEQHEKVDKILKESQERTRKIMTPIMREELQRTTAEFREVLTADQRVRFEEMLKQKRPRDQRDMRDPREPHHPPGPGDRPLDTSKPPGVATNQ